MIERIDKVFSKNKQPVNKINIDCKKNIKNMKVEKNDTAKELVHPKSKLLTPNRVSSATPLNSKPIEIKNEMKLNEPIVKSTSTTHLLSEDNTTKLFNKEDTLDKNEHQNHKIATGSKKYNISLDKILSEDTEKKLDMKSDKFVNESDSSELKSTTTKHTSDTKDTDDCSQKGYNMKHVNTKNTISSNDINETEQSKDTCDNNINEMQPDNCIAVEEKIASQRLEDSKVLHRDVEKIIQLNTTSPENSLKRFKKENMLIDNDKPVFETPKDQSVFEDISELMAGQSEAEKKSRLCENQTNLDIDTGATILKCQDLTVIKTSSIECVNKEISTVESVDNVESEHMLEHVSKPPSPTVFDATVESVDNVESEHKLEHVSKPASPAVFDEAVESVDNVESEHKLEHDLKPPSPTVFDTTVESVDNVESEHKLEHVSKPPSLTMFDETVGSVDNVESEHMLEHVSKPLSPTVFDEKQAKEKKNQHFTKEEISSIACVDKEISTVESVT